MRNRTVTRLAVIGLGAVLSAAVQAAEPEDLIKYRKNVMKAIGGDMGAIAAVMQGKAGDPAHLKMLATGLNANAHVVRDIFPEDSAMGDTEAKAEIWDKPQEFDAAVSKLETAAEGFLAAADGGDKAAIGAALKELGGACKNCHDNFRQKKE